MPTKKLILGSWFDETPGAIPTPTYIAANIAYLSTLPFDGIAIYIREPDLNPNVTTAIFKDAEITYDAIMTAMDPLDGLSFGNLTDNFAYIWASEPVDFFDDWTNVLLNFGNLARACRDQGLKGIMYDNEQYGANWMNYGGDTVYHETKTLQEYYDQAYLRGQEAMAAMIAQFPGIKVMHLHGPYISDPDSDATLDMNDVSSSNELMGPFFAGMLQAATSPAQVIDGGELYNYRTTAEFAAGYTFRKVTFGGGAFNCPFLPAPARAVWSDRCGISWGIYDSDMASASEQETTITNALLSADEYVWFYTEDFEYMAQTGGAGKPSQALLDAVTNGRAAAQTVSGPSILIPG